MYVLFASSVCATLGHFVFIVLSHEASFIKHVYLTGCATNVINHYFRGNNKPLRLIDKTVTAFVAANDLFYIHDPVTFSWWLATMYLYMYAKVLRMQVLHVMAHACFAACHARILLN